VKRILLMGNPNVGKSSVFARLTGADVIASNYPGTTVGFTKGRMLLDGEQVEVVDAPGTYTLDAGSRAEEVAVQMLHDCSVVVNVIDASALERGLPLTLQLLKCGKPVVTILNMWDAAKHGGIEIDVEALEQRLGVPVVPTCALTGEGFKHLIDRLKEARANTIEYDDDERWHLIGDTIEATQKVTHRHHTLLEILGDASVHPATGLPIALVLVAGTFTIIRYIGEGLINGVFDPLFYHLWAPVIHKISGWLGGQGVLHSVLIGRVGPDGIDFVEALGVLTTGFYVPIAMVLPYVVSFYLALGVMEDTGYLPRLGVLLDSLMHRLGLHGLAIIPMMLGLGCNVPGALATRLVETRKERFICATLMAICVPCMAQLAIIFTLIAHEGVMGLGPVFLTLILLWFTLGMILSRFVKGATPEIIMEIPPYRLPYMRGLFKKLWIRTRHFICEAVPYVLLGVLLMNLLDTLGVIRAIGTVARPVVSGIFGLPQNAVGALVIGFLRKDVAVGMLGPLHLSLRQLIVASVVLTIYFPCVATFMVMFKELGWRDLLKSAGIMFVCSLLVGGLLNFVLGLLPYYR